jgi:adenylate cyclase
LAYSGLCDSYAVLSYIGVMHPREVWPKCRDAAARAVAIDDSLAEAHTSLGTVRAFADWNWREAENEFRRAIELNPRYVQARTWFAFQVLAPLGRLDEATAQIQTALEVEPLSATVNLHAAMVALQQLQSDTAIEYASTALELDPGFVFAHVWLGMAYELQRQYDAAIAEFEKVTQPLREVAPGWQGLLAHALARAADDRSALLVVGYPVLDPLRSHARFARLMARVGLPPDPLGAARAVR